MQVGTEAEPYEGQATIMLHGHVRSRELPIYGTKVVGVRQGALELHGRETATPWTRLGATVQPGGTTIDLEDAVDWQVCKKPNLEYFITKIWHIPQLNSTLQHFVTFLFNAFHVAKLTAIGILCNL